MAKANLELAKLKNPRTLHDKATAIAQLRPFSGMQYDFTGVFQNSEAIDLLVEINGILTSSAWSRQSLPGRFPALAIFGQTDAVNVGFSTGIDIVVEGSGLRTGRVWNAASTLGSSAPLKLRSSEES